MAVWPSLPFLSEFYFRTGYKLKSGSNFRSLIELTKVLRKVSMVIQKTILTLLSVPHAKIKLRQERERRPNSHVLPILPISPFPVWVLFSHGVNVRRGYGVAEIAMI